MKYSKTREGEPLGTADGVAIWVFCILFMAFSTPYSYAFLERLWGIGSSDIFTYKVVLSVSAFYLSLICMVFALDIIMRLARIWSGAK